MNRTLLIAILGACLLLTAPVCGSIPHTIDSPEGATWTITRDEFTVAAGASPTTLTLEAGVYILHAAGASVYREDRLRRSDLQDTDHTLHIGLAETDVHPPSARILTMDVYQEPSGDPYCSAGYIYLEYDGPENGETALLPGMSYAGQWSLTCESHGCLTPTPTPTSTPLFRTRASPILSLLDGDGTPVDFVRDGERDVSPGEARSGPGQAGPPSDRGCCGPFAHVYARYDAPSFAITQLLAIFYCSSGSSLGEYGMTSSQSGMFVVDGPPLRDLDKVDVVAPRLYSISRVQSYTDGEARLHVQFSEPVEGVDLSDFVFYDSAGLQVAPLRMIGSNFEYRVDVSETGPGGEYTVCLTDDPAITDYNGHSLEPSECGLYSFESFSPELTLDLYFDDDTPSSSVVKFSLSSNEALNPDSIRVTRLLGTVSFFSDYIATAQPLPGNDTGTEWVVQVEAEGGEFRDGTLGIRLAARDTSGNETVADSPRHTLNFRPPLGTWEPIGPAYTNDPAELGFTLESDSELVDVAPGDFLLHQLAHPSAHLSVQPVSSVEWRLMVNLSAGKEAAEDMFSIEVKADSLFDADGLSMPSTSSPMLHYDPVPPEVTLSAVPESSSVLDMTATFRVSASEAVTVHVDNSQIFASLADGFEILEIIDFGTSMVDIVVGHPGSQPRSGTIGISFAPGDIRDLATNEAVYVSGVAEVSHVFVGPSPTISPTTTASPIPSPTIAPTLTKTPAITITPVPSTPPPTPTTPAPTATTVPPTPTAPTPTATTPAATETAVPTLSPTLSATATTTPSPIPTSTPDPVISFEFESGSEGWSAAAPVEFTAPIAQAANGSLVLRVTDNTNTFGFWESRLQPQMDADSWLDVRARVASSLLTPEFVPVLRLRSSNMDFSRSDALAITSTGGAPVLSPTNSAEFRYIARVDGTPFRLSFDVLGFDPSDSADCWLALEGLEVRALNPPTSARGAAVVEYNFASGQSHGFTPRTADGLAQPSFEAAAQGLAIRAEETGSNPPQFGYWGLESSVPMQAGLHELRWTLRGSAQSAAGVPTARLRVNDSTLQWSAFANLESEGFNQIVTADGTPATVTLLVDVPEAVAGANWVFSFDFLQTDAALPGGKLTLESLEVFRIEE